MFSCLMLLSIDDIRKDALKSICNKSSKFVAAKFIQQELVLSESLYNQLTDKEGYGCFKDQAGNIENFNEDRLK